MAFLSASVAIGKSTKKSNFDQLLNNTQDNRSRASSLESGAVAIIHSEPQTFNSSTVFNATATFNATANFNSAIIFPAYGEIGTLTIAASTAWADDTTYEPGTTVAGNTLIRMDETSEASLNARGGTNIVFLANSASLGLTGTWRLLTRVRMVTNNNIPIGLLQRIA
ncbi:hypothetical protein LCGC14_2861110 [marine sediment metagenome]|uniref:Uncharacterized protein n=1 Tax=marine sediment metagenome TaxID=412755 RepID=A0A0F8Y5V6_9ZZZZ